MESETSRSQTDGAAPGALVVTRRSGNLCLVEVADATGQSPDQYLVSSEQSAPVIRTVRENGTLLMPTRVLDATSELARKIFSAAGLS